MFCVPKLRYLTYYLRPYAEDDSGCCLMDFFMCLVSYHTSPKSPIASPKSPIASPPNIARRSNAAPSIGALPAKASLAAVDVDS